MSTIVEEHLTVLDGLDFDVPCVVKDDHAAELLVGCRSCDQTVFACAEHFEAYRAYAVAWLARSPGGTIECDICGFTAASFDELVITRSIS